MTDSNQNQKILLNVYTRRSLIGLSLFFAVLSLCVLGWYIDSVDGLVTGAIVAIFLVVTVALYMRKRESRVVTVQLDDLAKSFIDEAGAKHLGVIRLLAQRYGHKNYEKIQQEARRKHSIQADEGDFIFVEVIPILAENHDSLSVTGHLEGNFQVLRCKSPAAANAIAALLLHLRDLEHENPHIYLSWSEGHPLAYALKYAFFGEGGTAPVIREILREHEREPDKRPIVHVA